MKRSIKVLDLGPGTGFPMLELAERLGNSSFVSGLDIWTSAVKRIREKAQKHEITNVEAIVGNAEEIPFRDGVFDLIVSNVGLNNFENKIKVLKECRRVLKRSGKICLTTNLRGHMAEFYEIFEHVLVEMELFDAKTALCEHIEHRVDLDTVRDLFDKSGLDITREIETSTILRFADGEALLKHHFIRYGFLEKWLDVVPDYKRKDLITLLEKSLTYVARERGDLRLTIPILFVEGEQK